MPIKRGAELGVCKSYPVFNKVCKVSNIRVSIIFYMLLVLFNNAYQGPKLEIYKRVVRPELMFCGPLNIIDTLSRPHYNLLYYLRQSEILNICTHHFSTIDCLFAGDREGDLFRQNSLLTKKASAISRSHPGRGCG